jgi:hypothetical protein
MDYQPPEFSMTARHIATRIEKLETARGRPDEILLCWRKPESAVAAAVANSEHSPGDKVICAEWFADSEMPPPRWYGDRLLSKLTPREHDNIIESLERIATTGQRDPGFVPIPNTPSHRVPELRDNELLHICLGVET